MSAATVLIVEDNAATRKMMRIALSAEGYAVLEAEDGATALRLAASHAPAMVLLDSAQGIVAKSQGGTEAIVAALAPYLASTPATSGEGA